MQQPVACADRALDVASGYSALMMSNSMTQRAIANVERAAAIALAELFVLECSLATTEEIIAPRIIRAGHP